MDTRGIVTQPEISTPTLPITAMPSQPILLGILNGGAVGVDRFWPVSRASSSACTAGSVWPAWQEPFNAGAVSAGQGHRQRHTVHFIGR
jgi:hypothetical protein